MLSSGPNFSGVSAASSSWPCCCRSSAEKSSLHWVEPALYETQTLSFTRSLVYSTELGPLAVTKVSMQSE